MKIITIANRKGGVGKTTSTLAVGQVLAHQGHRVLLIDCDPQCNLTQSFPELPLTDGNLVQLLNGEREALVEVMQPVSENLFLVHATKSLTQAEQVLSTKMEYMMLFRNALQGLEDHVEYVLFDTSPSPHSPLASAAMGCSDAVFIPLEPEYYAYEGLSSLLELVRRVRVNFNPRLQVGGLFLTKYNPGQRNSLHSEFIKLLQTDVVLGPLLMESTIRKNVVLPKTQVYRLNLYEAAADSNAVEDYEALTEEITRKLALA